MFWECARNDWLPPPPPDAPARAKCYRLARVSERFESGALLFSASFSKRGLNAEEQCDGASGQSSDLNIKIEARIWTTGLN